LGNEVENIEWIREKESDIFTVARVTKDQNEIEAIRSAGRRTGEVIQDVVDLFRSAERIDGILINGETGEPLKIKDVKRFVTYSLARRALLENEETIFSIGYDTAVPHNRGKDEDSIVEGLPIIFDIFPTDARSGYNYDCTRSLVVGNPSEDYLKLYEDVKGAVELAEGLLIEGASGSGVNNAVVDFFEERGHTTLRTEGNFTDGYIHNLGHGIGLNVHEVPSLGLFPASNDTLEKGMVFTVEPGLYYPDRSIGVRLENCYWINEDGIGERVVEIPYIHHIE
jgi:Xaa-Pro aminopeptidase